MRLVTITFALLAQILWIPAAYAVIYRQNSMKCGQTEDARTVSSVTNRSFSGSGAFSIAFERDQASPTEQKAQTLQNSTFSDQGAKMPPSVGTPVEVVRCLPPGRIVQLAIGKIEKIENSQYIARVMAPTKVASLDSPAFTRSLVLNRNLYWQPMQGDMIRVLTPQVVHVQRIWPRFEFEINELFETRNGDDGENISLSAAGRQLLVESFEQIQAFDGRFLVESDSKIPETGLSKSRDLAQLRAGLIANYLAQVFELERDRLVARGLQRPPAHVEMMKVSRAGPGQPLVRDSITLRILKETRD
jgi:hypothetical protein